jgi:putative transposase
MRDYKNLTHTRYGCKYHIVFIPKKRRKIIFGTLRKHLGEICHELARPKGVVIEAGQLMKDHVHMCLSIPPKLVVSNIVGYLKGKFAISIARNFKGKQKNFAGETFWARGYFVSTVGLDEEMVREYIRNQEKNDVDRDQLKLVFNVSLALTLAL